MSFHRREDGDVFTMVDKQPKNKVPMQLYERSVKGFMDVIVLKELGKGNSIGAHEIRALIYKKFHVLISSGTIYSLLYSMKRDGFIEGIIEGRKRVYRLTDEGKGTLENISESIDKIILLIKAILEK
jgi:DNA-binding PadR family transcriptional regulator